jgi:DNA-binding transcriptional ArsR family regulator
MVGVTKTGLAAFGALVADPTRAEILATLMDGRAHTGSELARHVGVAASTASEHLSRLLDARMVAVQPQGRHRYWRLAGPEVAELLEALGACTPVNLPAGPRAPAMLAYARTCYDHLAGQVAVGLYDRLLAAGHLATCDDHHLTVTTSGFELLAAIGADVEAITGSRRPKARACLDWTERRHHLAGTAGKVLLDALLANGWARRSRRSRSIGITESGRSALAAHFGLDQGRAG